MIELLPMTVPAARRIALWRYEPPYDFYDGSEAEVPVMLDPANHYFAVLADGALAGYVCVGPDARVAGEQADEEADDIGWGFRPDLTGRGIASRWLPVVLELLDEVLHARTQRVVMAAWNERSKAAARGLGFGTPVPLSNDAGEWVVLTRARPQTPEHLVPRSARDEPGHR
jgi:[ribosomal protein S18]-alanine N-acetyltransferase